ncbi:GNAT family N-acetyltransferase [Rummeliibacillus pycnus]|uniref:GNAT family N-acetyltransferase n=1 Tax=Rummeliibacillus pycnus TaxID=101070 RepID=UPI0037CB28D2
MEIKLLNENEEFVETVSKMIYKEFVLSSSNKMPFNDVVDFFSNTHAFKFPITFIAILDNQCVGTVSVFENDYKKLPNYKPWLASLYVEPNYRDRKIGVQLIEALLKHLVVLGFKEVYLKTENASEYYKNRCWKLVESVLNDHNENIDIFKYSLV